MCERLLRLALVGMMVLFADAMALAQPADKTDDPLPKGAKVRFGVTRPILRTGPAVGLLPPNYNNFLAPTMTGGVKRYDLGTGRPLQKDGIVGPGNVVVSADGKRAAVARPGTITIVNAINGKEILAVMPPDGVIISGTPGVSLSADGKILAFGGRGNELRGSVVVLDVDKNEVHAVVETAQLAPVFPTLSPDGKTLVTHGPPAKAPTLKEAKPAQPKPKPDPTLDPARTAQVWEVESGKELFKARVTGMGGVVVSAAFFPDGDIVALSAGDGPIDLWDVKVGKRVQTLLGRKGQGVKVAVAPNGKTIASVGPDYRIQRWTSEGKPIGVTDPPPNIMVAQVSGLTFADNDRVIGWVTAHQFCRAWEAPTNKLLSPLMDHSAAIRSIAFAKEEKGHGGMTSGFDGRVFRWDLLTGNLGEEIQVRPAYLPGQPLVRPVINLSSNAVRATWLRTPIEVFDMATGEDLFSVPNPSTPPTPVTMNLSPDGLKLLTVSRQATGKRIGSCVVWDLMKQQRFAEFEVPGTANAAAPLAVLSPDESRIVLGSTRFGLGGGVLTITGFDAKTGKKLAEVEDPASAGNVSFAAADDTSVVLASNLGRVWSIDYANGRVEGEIDKIIAQGELPISGSVVFSPDGKRFAIGVVGELFTTYGVRVYDWPGKKHLHTFIGHAGPVSALQFTPDGNSLASGAQDTSVIVWDLRKLPGPP